MTLLRPELYRSRNFDNWLQDFFHNDDPYQSLWTDFPRRGLPGNSLSGLAADFYEDANAFHAVLELPGVSKDDVNLELENSVLRVSGKHTDQEGDRSSSYEFSRSLALPDGVDSSKVSAEMKDGLLSVNIPKLEETKPRTIEVQ